VDGSPDLYDGNPGNAGDNGSDGTYTDITY
jgi:hypothetical protein